MFTRQDLTDVIVRECDKIKETFLYKNKSYGQNGSPFFNFQQAAREELGDESYNGMYKTLRIYVQKHDAAMKNNGLSDQEAIERLRDIAVYQLIAIGMKEAMDRGGDSD